MSNIVIDAARHHGSYEPFDYENIISVANEMQGINGKFTERTDRELHFTDRQGASSLDWTLGIL